MKKIFQNKVNLIFLLIFTIALISRCYSFLRVPGGIHQDEAYALYESWSLLNFGVDSWGYHNPVYFISWGSGMNVLLSYISIPFVKFFGMNLIAIRLPILIASLLTLVCVYFIGVELKNKKFALFVLFLLTISPWHIMASRWAIESNLAPALLMLSLYFIIKGTRKSSYFVWSAVFFGLSLYTYATIWIMVPLFLILVCIYLLLVNKIKLDRYVLISVVVLFVLALPLLLFLLVNNGLIHEIRTPLISIPKLLVDRGNEVSITSIFNGAKQLIKLLIFQIDDRLIDSTIHFGLYYHISIVFIVIGILSYFKTFIYSVKNKRFTNEAIFAIFLLTSLFNACLIQVIVIVRVNFIHIPLIICCAKGWYSLINIVKSEEKRNLIVKLSVIIYTCLFLAFQIEYHTVSAKELEKKFNYDFVSAVQFADKLNVERVHVNPELVGKYSILLYALEISPGEFATEAKYFNFPAPYLYMESFGKYQFYLVDYDYLDEQGAYVLCDGEEEFLRLGYMTRRFGNYFVAWRNV